MKKLLFLALCLGSFLPAYAQEGVYSLHLSNPQVTAITQDQDGYIWFGTSRGLNRYNGTNYTIFYASGAEGSLNNDHILSLCADTDGTLWIGTECGLNWYRDGRFHHMNSTVFDPVVHITEVDSTHVAFDGKSGHFVMEKADLSLAGYAAPDESGWMNTTRGGSVSFTDRDGGIWQADGKNGWTYTAKKQAFRSVNLSPGGERLSHPVFDREGYLWMRVGDRLCSYDPATMEPVWTDTQHPCSTIFLNSSGQLVVLEDVYYITTYSVHKGIPTQLRRARHEHEVFSMTEQEDGSLWLSEISNLVQGS